ncbi:PREDICTED: chorion peroxidase [Drosophila arizonae]|uniref:Chorion peroxidase n=1 Tax=Drosophila arizonae TaxID=7263 RepID=A0ABM1Q4G9_DROAR|nr:PREDICTED: chorion peroxidase [Drosophila arizonae]
MRIIYVLLIWWHVLYVQYEFKYVAAFSLRKNDLLDGEDVKENLEAPKTGLLKVCKSCKSVQCVPQIQCPAHVRMAQHEKPQICDLPAGKFGYCCKTGQNHTAGHKKARAVFQTILPPDVIEDARKNFKHLMHGVAQIPVNRGHPDFTHGIMFHSSPKDDFHNFALSNSAFELVIASQVFGKKEQVPLDDLITNNVPVEFSKTPLAQHCQSMPVCRGTLKYRTLDGTCNNPLSHRLHWGAAGQPMERLLPPAYEDGIWTPRAHSKDGTPLLSARDISRTLFADVHRPHPKYNLLIMQFAQLLAHDVSQSASVRLDENGGLVQCCSPDGRSILPPEKSHFACLPIPVSANDEFYSAFGVRCLNLVRLSLVPSADCQLSYGKQRNKVTHFLDASPIYGSSEESARELRTFRGGRLQMFNDFGRDMLPLTRDKSACGSEEPGSTCFKSGDGRTNQIISLITLHIVFAREHNRIASILAKLNPSASDEWLYQETRRIVIAEIQHITYNEFLPALIGPQQVKRFRLIPRQKGYSNEYNIDVNPAITNEFSGAAFRMGHSSVVGKFHIRDEIINIPDVMFNPSRMRKREFYDDMLQTLYTQPMQEVDSSITHGISRFLFRGHSPFGLDLAAINIQRGRDQGIRCYNDYLQVMGAPKLKSFDKFPRDVGEKLSHVYRTPDDIDLWVGGLLERAVEDGIVGITFAEIIADQFARFKHGDRYFYEYDNKVNPGAFNSAQLQEVRKASISRLLCDNADHLTLHSVPLAGFVRADFPGNTIVRCDDPRLPSVNLNAWRL